MIYYLRHIRLLIVEKKFLHAHVLIHTHHLFKPVSLLDLIIKTFLTEAKVIPVSWVTSMGCKCASAEFYAIFQFLLYISQDGCEKLYYMYFK